MGPPRLTSTCLPAVQTMATMKPLSPEAQASRGEFWVKNKALGPHVSSPHHLQVPAHKHALNLAQNFWPHAVRDSVWVRLGCSCPARLLPPLPEYGAAAG